MYLDTHDLHFEGNRTLRSFATCTHFTKFVVNKPCNSLQSNLVSTTLTYMTPSILHTFLRDQTF